MKLRIAWLYGHEMNIYGDRGNVIALSQRARWRGIEVETRTVGLGETLDAGDHDLFFWGGGQDREQASVAADLAGPKGRELAAAARDGVPMLTICGGYQLLGHYYQPHDADKLPGIGVLDVWSEAGPTRFIGNAVVETDEFGKLVGFENHSGLTWLGPAARPLGTAVAGHGNNGRDGSEGARQYRVVASYLHGALLPKNPVLTDWLLAAALERRYGRGTLAPLDDNLERRAHAALIQRAG